MHYATVLALTITLLAASASARIEGFYIPKTVAVNTDVKVEILGANYIQSIQDVAMAFGVQQGTNPTPASLGTLLGSKYLGPDNSNVVGNITAYIHIPAHTPRGPSTVTASLFSLLGAANSPDLDEFQANVQVRGHTSPEYVFSHRV